MTRYSAIKTTIAAAIMSLGIGGVAVAQPVTSPNDHRYVEPGQKFPTAPKVTFTPIGGYNVSTGKAPTFKPIGGYNISKPTPTGPAGISHKVPNQPETRHDRPKPREVTPTTPRPNRPSVSARPSTPTRPGNTVKPAAPKNPRYMNEYAVPTQPVYVRNTPTRTATRPTRPGSSGNSVRIVLPAPKPRATRPAPRPTTRTPNNPWAPLFPTTTVRDNRRPSAGTTVIRVRDHRTPRTGAAPSGIGIRNSSPADCPPPRRSTTRARSGASFSARIDASYSLKL